MGMRDYAVIVRGGTIVGAEGPAEADLAVADGKITAIGPELGGTTGEEIEARGLHVLPVGTAIRSVLTSEAPSTGGSSA